MITKKDHLQELQEAAEAVIDLAMHPNRPTVLRDKDTLKCLRLKRAVAQITSDPHEPAPWAPSKNLPYVSTSRPVQNYKD